MFKKLLIFVLCLTLTLSALAGCTLVTKNDQKNSLRVIATINAVSDSGEDKHTLNKFGYYEYYLSDNYLNVNPDKAAIFRDTTDNNPTVFYEKGGFIYVADANGQEGEYQEIYDISLDDLKPKTESWSISLEKKNIYKHQLFSYINSYGNEYMNNYGYTLERVVTEFMDLLVSREVNLVEAERYIAKGDIVLDQAFENAVNKNIYSQIDSQYKAYLNNIRRERGIEVIEELQNETTGSEPTYPLYPYTEEITEGEEEAWDISDPKYAAKWPGMVGSAEARSMEIEAMSRLVRGLCDLAREDFRLKGDERKEVLASIDEINRIINTQGMERVYPILGETALIKYLMGKSIREDEILNRLQDFIDGEITVSEDEVLKEYNRMVKNQELMYSEDISQYYSASGEKLIFVNPNPSKHIYVKHILIQFTDEQTAALNAFKASPTTSSSTEEYEVFRENLAKEIVGYLHVDGEDDLDNPLTINQISNIIRSQMATASADPKTAERTFDKLIYQYNQDPGMFDSALGYAVINQLEGEETDTYVAEFSAGARAFRNETNNDGSRKYKIGDILDYNVVTDFGVHFMYYSYERPTEKVSIHDYVTAGEYETYYELLVEAVEANKSNTLFSDWSTAIVHDYKKVTKQLKVYEKRYQDIYK